MSRRTKVILGVLCLAVLVAAASTTFAGKPNKPPSDPICDCYPIDAPVLCSNGITYLNQCVATCAHATDCVPTGGGGGGGPQP